MQPSPLAQVQSLPTAFDLSNDLPAAPSPSCSDAHRARSAGVAARLIERLRLRRRIRGAVVFYAAIVLVFLGGSNAFAQNAVLGATAYGSAGFNCQSCHGSLPGGAFLGIQNAADKPEVIDYSITHNFGNVMGAFAGVSATDRANIAAYIGQQLIPIVVDVGFNAPATAIPLGTDIWLLADRRTMQQTFSSLTQVGARGHGTVTFNRGTAFYTPDLNFFGTDTFSYQASGPGGVSSVRTVTIHVVPPAPTITTNPSEKITPFDTPITFTLPVEGFFTSITLTSVGGVGGTLTQPQGNADKTVTYKPPSNNFGGASFNYTVTYPTGTGTSATLTGTVNITVGAPTALATPDLSVTVPFNSAGFDIVLPVTGGFQNVIAVPAAAGGMIGGVITQPGGNTSTTVRYQPPANQSGVASFTYTATTTTLGGSATSSSGTVNITVSPAGAPITPNISVVVPFNSPGFDIVLPVTGGFQNTIAVQGPVTGIGGGVTQPNGPASTTVTYKPTADQFGLASFMYTATTGGSAGVSSTGTVSITVSPPGGAPSAGAATLTVPLNTPTTLDLQPFITGSIIAGIAIVSAPTHGTVTVSGTQVTFTPANNYFGSDGFSYLAFGNGQQSQPALVTINVVGRPDPSQDPEVIGLIAAQVEAARRFSRTQLSNYQWRLELLHRSHAQGPDSAGGAGRRALAASGKALGGVSPGPDYSAADQRSDATIARMSGVNDGGKDLSGLMQRTSLPAAAPLKDGTSDGAVPGVLGMLGTVMNVAQTRSVNLASTGLGEAPADGGGVGVWTGGDLVFGKRDALGHQGRLDFRTSGVTIAADRRFSDKFVAGIGLGYGHDKTDVGTNGTKLRARDASVAYYSTFQPHPQTFLDAVFGYGKLYLDTDRFVEPINDFARAKRRGEQVFGSLTAGYDYRKNQLLLTPYGRLDYSVDRLAQASESGAGLYALTYFGATIPSGDVALGLRAESAHETSVGVALPRFRVEYLRDLGSNRQAQVAYADLVAQRYTVIPETISRNSLLLAVGSDLLVRNGLALGIDYEFQRSSGKARSQAIRLRLAVPLGP